MPDGWVIEQQSSRRWVVYQDRRWVAEEDDYFDALAVIQRAGAESYTMIESDGYETRYRADEVAIF